MSMQLNITYSGITLDFMAGGYKLLDGFFPETKPQSVVILIWFGDRKGLCRKAD